MNLLTDEKSSDKESSVSNSKSITNERNDMNKYINELPNKITPEMVLELPGITESNKKECYSNE